MDLVNPLRSVAPSVDSDVLAVLLRTHAPLTGQRVADLAGRSGTQVREVLGRLVEHGLVLSERHGQSVSYSLNREHVLVPALEVIQEALPTVLDRVRSAVEAWATPAAGVMVFGSAARGEAGPESDIDLLLVRPDDVEYEDAVWEAQRYELQRATATWAGNRVQVVEVSAAELAQAIRRVEPLVENLRADGIVLAGSIRGM